MRWQPVLGGVLGLALLEAALSSKAASGRVGQLLQGVASIVSHVLSPAVPAIPDLRKRAATSSAVPAVLTSGGSDSSGGSSDQSGGSKSYPADWNTSPASLFV